MRNEPLGRSRDHAQKVREPLSPTRTSMHRAVRKVTNSVAAFDLMHDSMARDENVSFVPLREGDLTCLETQLRVGTGAGRKWGLVDGYLHASMCLRRCGVMEKDIHHDPVNFGDCVFRICPMFHYKSAGQLRALQKHRRRHSTDDPRVWSGVV